jgi:NADH:ubiquinone oxidoreductase subunit E
MATAQVCVAASCLALHGEAVLDAVRARLTGSADDAVMQVGCLGLCAAGPLVRPTPSPTPGSTRPP